MTVHTYATLSLTLSAICIIMSRLALLQVLYSSKPFSPITFCMSCVAQGILTPCVAWQCFVCLILGVVLLCWPLSTVIRPMERLKYWQEYSQFSCDSAWIIAIWGWNPISEHVPYVSHNWFDMLKLSCLCELLFLTHTTLRFNLFTLVCTENSRPVIVVLKRWVTSFFNTVYALHV